jgi:hypothetical protein
LHDKQWILSICHQSLLLCGRYWYKLPRWSQIATNERDNVLGKTLNNAGPRWVLLCTSLVTLVIVSREHGSKFSMSRSSNVWACISHLVLPCCHLKVVSYCSKVLSFL